MKTLFIAIWILVAAVAGYAQATNGGPSPLTNVAITYFVCAKANAGTCVYNGDGGTVAATIADTNDCTSKATPCRTIDGVRAKLAGSVISSVVTIQLADAAGTGTDLYRPNGTVFDNPVRSGEPDLALELQERATNTLGTYPRAYIYLKGNDTTPANVALCGAAACSATATDTIGVVFTNTVARISGIGAKNFLLGPSSTAFQLLRSTVYLENSAFTGTNVASDQEWLAFPADHTVLKIGGTITLTNGGLLNSANYAHVNFRTPAGRASITGTVSGTFAGMISSNENSYVAVDGPTMSFSGAGTYTIFLAQNHSTIYWNDDSTFTAPAWSFTANGAGITYYKALDNSFMEEGCRTVGQLTCNIGNTTPIAVHHSADANSYIKYAAVATGATVQDVATNYSIIQKSTGSSPTISSGFGTSPSVVAGNVPLAFQINVGTGGTATNGVIGLPLAKNGWVCNGNDITTKSTTVFVLKQTASSTTTATVGNFNTSGAAAAWVASDLLQVSCSPY